MSPLSRPEAKNLAGMRSRGDVSVIRTLGRAALRSDVNQNDEAEDERNHGRDNPPAVIFALSPANGGCAHLLQPRDAAPEGWMKAKDKIVAGRGAFLRFRRFSQARRRHCRLAETPLEIRRVRFNFSYAA